MKFELKAIKHSEFASHETSCFEAKLYVDGKILCGVSNDGQGGCDHRYSVKGSPDNIFSTLEKIDHELAKETITCDFDDGDGNPVELDNSLELVVGKLLTIHLIDKDIKKSLNKICYVNNGSVFTLQAKHKPTPANIEAVKKCTWWKPNSVILNGKSVEECRQYFK